MMSTMSAVNNVRRQQCPPSTMSAVNDVNDVNRVNDVKTPTPAACGGVSAVRPPAAAFRGEAACGGV
jgi:hypothetical protein